MFFAIEGSVNDGHDYIQQVIDAGCNAIIVSKEVETPEELQCYSVENTNKALATMASNFYGEPSKELKLIGITGTNGKTTIATLYYSISTKSLVIKLDYYLL